MIKCFEEYSEMIQLYYCAYFNAKKTEFAVSDYKKISGKK